ncbi:hypothetical protein HQ487_05280 [Candidatus Uhrbacteria bacterium]|nr:hypothetical protein [Candidatus Uhrbacteria bacterium]
MFDRLRKEVGEFLDFLHAEGNQNVLSGTIMLFLFIMAEWLAAVWRVTDDLLEVSSGDFTDSSVRLMSLMQFLGAFITFHGLSILCRKRVDLPSYFLACAFTGLLGLLMYEVFLT